MNRQAMLDRLNNGFQLAYAEAASFELSKGMPRTMAQTVIKALCSEATESGVSLSSLLEIKFP